MRCVRISQDAGQLCALGVSGISGIASLTQPGTLHLIRNADRTVEVTTDVGLSITNDWLGGRARHVEVRTLDATWKDVTDACQGNTIPPELVRYWSGIQERTLIQFRLEY
jgi:hypothetical protein